MSDDQPFKRERPDTLPGATVRINTGYGRVYVNINEAVDDDGTRVPFEVFVHGGSSGGIYNNMSEALSKTISNALRMSNHPRHTLREIAEDMEGMWATQVAEDNGDMIRSIPDAVGIALLRYLDDKIDPPEPIRDDANGEPISLGEGLP